MGVMEDENLHHWILGSDTVIVRVTGKAVGLDGLATLVAHFIGLGEFFKAAQVESATSHVIGTSLEQGASHSKAALALLDEHGLVTATEEAQQLALDVLLSLAYGAIPKGPERDRVNERVKELTNSNKKLRVGDATQLALSLFLPILYECFGCDVRGWDAGVEVNEESLYQGVCAWYENSYPLLEQHAASVVGARREAVLMSLLA